MSETASNRRVVLKATATEFVPVRNPIPARPSVDISSLRERIKQTRLSLEQILLNGMQSKDIPLRQIMDKDPSGKNFVKIHYLVRTYPQLTQIVDERLIYSAIHDSMRLELSPCATSVSYSSTARDVKCTVYVDGFEPCNDLNALYNQFSVFGSIRSIVPCSHVLTSVEEFTGYAELPVSTSPVRSALIEFFSKRHAFDAVAVATGKVADSAAIEGKAFDISAFAGMHIMPMFAYLPLIKRKRELWAAMRLARSRAAADASTAPPAQPAVVRGECADETVAKHEPAGATCTSTTQTRARTQHRTDTKLRTSPGESSKPVTDKRAPTQQSRARMARVPATALSSQDFPTLMDAAPAQRAPVLGAWGQRSVPRTTTQE